MIFCSPSLKALPGVATTNLFNPAEVRMLPNGPVKELETQTHFVAILSLGIPSTIPRTSFFVETIWMPFASDNMNTFTGYSAADLEDADDVDANLPSLEFGTSLALLKPKTTSGWLAVNMNVIDQVSPAAEPEDAREYTHKLSLELNTTLGIFNWLPKGNWLRNVTAYATLGYVATGIPDEGDEIPKNTRVFLEDASPWSFWSGLAIPIAPIAPQP